MYFQPNTKKVSEDILQQERLLWAEDLIQKISVKTSSYLPREKQNTKTSFLINVVQKVSKENIEPEDWREFQVKAEEVVHELPHKAIDGKFDYGRSLNVVARFKTYVLKKFKFVPKGAYLKIGLFGGIVGGLILGLVFDYFFSGLVFGVGLGLIYGSIQDKKALAKNRVL